MMVHAKLILAYPKGNTSSRLKIMNLVVPYFLFISFFLIYFYFSIFRTLGLGVEVISHTVTSVISDGVVTTLVTKLKRKE